MIRKSFDEVVLFARTGLNPRTNFKLGRGNNKYITIKNIHNNSLIIDENTDKIDDEAIKMIHKRSQIKKGDILFCSIGRMGDMYIIPDEPNGWDINESVFAFTLNEKIIRQKYFYYLFKHQDTLDYLTQNSSGSTFKSIKMNQLKRMVFSLPSLEMQDCIVATLDNANSIIETRQHELHLLDALIKARFVELFGQDGFDYVRVGDVIIQQTVVERITHPEQEKYVTVGIRGTGARQRVIKDGKTPVPFSGYRVKAGEFIYSRIDARNGAFAVLSDQLDGAVVSKDFPVFTINKERIYPEFLLQSVLQEDFISQIRQSSFGATNRQRIKEDVFAEYKIKLPSLHHQSQFATLVAQVDKSKVVVQIAL